MAKINRITIKGFKSIKSLEDFSLSSGLNVLIGANGAGKSNFIGYFKFLNSIVNERMQLVTKKSGGAGKVLHNGQKINKLIESKVNFDNNGYFFNLTPTNSGGFIFEKEALFLDGLYGKSTYPMGSGHEETNLFSSKAKQNVAAYVIPAVKSWIAYHFHDTGDSANVKQYTDLNNNIALETDAGNLAPFLYKLQQSNPIHYKGIVKAVKMIAPFFQDFVLRPDPFNNDMIQLEWRSKESDQPFTANQLSDGTLRFICLATVLLQPTPPSTIIMDEPELGLHPYALSILGSLIRSASNQTQIIISTQSVQLVNEFNADDVIVVDRDDEQSTFTRLEDKKLREWLKSYNLGELWEKNVIGGRPTND